jgi:hypothetical protein
MDFYRASNSPSWERLWKALYVEDGNLQLGCVFLRELSNRPIVRGNIVERIE